MCCGFLFLFFMYCYVDFLLFWIYWVFWVVWWWLLWLIGLELCVFWCVLDCLFCRWFVSWFFCCLLELFGCYVVDCCVNVYVKSGLFWLELRCIKGFSDICKFLLNVWLLKCFNFDICGLGVCGWYESLLWCCMKDLKNFFGIFLNVVDCLCVVGLVVCIVGKNCGMF